jgi:putative solute:sodium symporter small subunit
MRPALMLKRRPLPRKAPGDAQPVLRAFLATLPSRRHPQCRVASAARPQGGATPMSSPNEARHWPRTVRLMWIMLGLWAFFSFFIHFFVTSLNKIVIFGFPLGFYMAAQGSLIAFVVMLFWFAHAQDKIDRECGVAEDE